MLKADVVILGLGYVGLPLAIEAASNTLKVAGYDTNDSVVSNLNNSVSKSVPDVSMQRLGHIIDMHLGNESSGQVIQKQTNQTENTIKFNYHMGGELSLIHI